MGDGHLSLEYVQYTKISSSCQGERLSTCISHRYYNRGRLLLFWGLIEFF